MAKYSISILAHQNIALTRRCVESVLANSDDFRLILTDNGCVDGTREYFAGLAKMYHFVTAIHNPTNLGFIEPNREAFKYASEFHVLLNNDTVVYPCWLERLNEPFRRDPKAALVGVTGNCCQLRADFKGESGPRFEYIEFSIVMMRSDAVRKVEPNLFPPELEGAYGEDSYLSLRMREAGYNLHRVPLQFTHYRGATSAIVPQAREWERKNHLFLQKRFRRYMISRRFDHPIIVKRRDAHGDVLLTTAIIQALKKKNPVAQIQVETNLPQMFAGNPDVGHVGRAIVQTPDAEVYDLNGASEMRPHLNLIDAYAEVAHVQGCRRVAHFHIPGGDLEWAQRTLLGDDWVAVHCGPSWRDKTWPMDRWRELIMGIPSRVVVVGSDTNFLMPADLDLRGKTNMGQLAAILRRCRLFIGIDSLPIHLAQAVATPVVGLFGSTFPELILNEGSQWAGARSDPSHPGSGLRHAVPGKTYVECPEGNPMETISVQSVALNIKAMTRLEEVKEFRSL